MLSKKDIIEINKTFENGTLVNESSLDYIVKTNARSKNWIRAAAIIVRGILIDHVFEDGNKRTAAAALIGIMELNKVPYDPQKVGDLIVTMLKKNTTNVKEIERMIKNVRK